MNRVLVVGRLVRDPEVASTNTGIKYARFTVAVDRTVSNGTDFVPVVAWRNSAEFVEKYMRKGSLVSVDGRFSSSSYQNRDNQTVTRYEVTADSVQGLESKAQQEARAQSSGASVTPSGPSREAPTTTVQFEDQGDKKSPTNNDQDVP